MFADNTISFKSFLFDISDLKVSGLTEKYNSTIKCNTSSFRYWIVFSNITGKCMECTNKHSGDWAPLQYLTLESVVKAGPKIASVKCVSASMPLGSHELE